MRAEIKSMFSLEVDDLENYKPENPTNFSFGLSLSIGPKKEKGEEVFFVTVCTPDSLKEEYREDDVLLCMNRIIMFRYDYHLLMMKLENYLNSLNEESWELLALKIDRIAHWEFRDYKELN